MALPHVFVTRRIPEQGLRLLQAFCVVDLWPEELPPSAEVLRSHAQSCDGLLSLLTDRIDGDLLDACPDLRVVSNMAVGWDNIDVAAATARGVLVGNTPGVLTETTADLAFALLMAAARRLPEGQAYIREGHWQTWGPLVLLGTDVHHATLGIVGLGRIGAEVARRARGFQMRVLYNNPRRQRDLEAELGVEYLPLADLLQAADFVSLHAPLTPSTRGMINAATLRLMRPTAILINTARGALVETPALVAALESRAIAGAALDVTDPEPLPADHPLNHLPNCLVVPHIASATSATRGQMAEMAARNLLAGLRGEALPHGLNPVAVGTGRQTLPITYEL